MAPVIPFRNDESTNTTASSPTVAILTRRDGTTPKPTYNPGVGSRPPQSFNNKAYFALFALLGAAMVITSIWFFFWAKHGGFVWEKGDWEDYKSTVLRRKGKDGKTLTNATPATNLGGKSIAGTFDFERDSRREEMTEINGSAREGRRESEKKSSRPHRNRGRAPSDEDLRAYRRERAAKVGGLNRQEEGSHFDYSNASHSDLGSNISSRPLRPKQQEPTKAEKKAAEKEAKKEEKQKKKDEKKQKKEMQKQQSANQKQQSTQARQPSRTRHTFAADEASVLGGSSIHPDSSASQAAAARENYFSAYRPPAPPHAASRRNEQRQTSSQTRYTQRPSSRQPSPTKPATAARRHHQQASFDAYSDAGTNETGTKSYTHHIPELSRGSRETGFRRGGGRGGRRDSLSDSDDDGDMTGFIRR